MIKIIPIDAVAHAEGAAQLDLILQVVFLYKVLELFHNLAGALQMAGASYTNINVHFLSPYSP